MRDALHPMLAAACVALRPSHADSPPKQQCISAHKCTPEPADAQQTSDTFGVGFVSGVTTTSSSIPIAAGLHTFLLQYYIGAAPTPAYLDVKVRKEQSLHHCSRCTCPEPGIHTRGAKRSDFCDRFVQAAPCRSRSHSAP